MKGSSPSQFNLRNLFRLAGVTLAVLYVFSVRSVGGDE